MHDEDGSIKGGCAARRGRARMQRATDPAVQRAREVRRPPYVPRAAALRPLLLQARPGHPQPAAIRWHTAASASARCMGWEMSSLVQNSLAVAFGPVYIDYASAMRACT